jgi:hypothetical protein
LLRKKQKGRQNETRRQADYTVFLNARRHKRNQGSYFGMGEKEKLLMFRTPINTDMASLLT